MLRQWSDSEVAVHYKVHRVTSEMIADENNLRRWLVDRYVEKDKMLDDFYRNGQFPGSSRSIDFDTGRAVLVQLFWMVSFYLHYSIWLRSLCIFAVRMFSTMLGWF